MQIVIQLSGGQGFLPKLNSNAEYQAFAQDIIDRYGNTEYIDYEALEYWEIESRWIRFKNWLKAFPFRK